MGLCASQEADLFALGAGRPQVQILSPRFEEIPANTMFSVSVQCLGGDWSGERWEGVAAGVGGEKLVEVGEQRSVLEPACD